MSVLGAASARRPGSQALPSNRFAHNNDEEKAGHGCGQTSTPRAPNPGGAAALMRTTTPQLLLSGCDFVADGTVNNGNAQSAELLSSRRRDQRIEPQLIGRTEKCSSQN